MPTGIDHVVIAVADPDAAAAELTERVGLAFTGGGRHPGLGTFNRLALPRGAHPGLVGRAGVGGGGGGAPPPPPAPAPEHPPFLTKPAPPGPEGAPAAREERRSFVHPLG